MPVYDLKCDSAEQHIVRDEFRMHAPVDDDFGCCAHCDGHLHTYWGETHSVRKFDAFVPQVHEGKRFDTRESWDKHLRLLQKSHPSSDIVVEGASKRIDRADAEDIRHDLYRDNGFRNEREYNQHMHDLKRSAQPRRN